MRLIDGEKLFDKLLEKGPIDKAVVIHEMSIQPTIEAIPIDFIRDLIIACDKEGRKSHVAGMRFLIRQWHEENKKERPQLW